MVQLVGVLPLLEVIERPEPDRFLGRFPLGVGGEEDDLGPGGVRLRSPQHVQAVAVRHAEIGDDEVEDFLGERLGGGRGAVGLGHAVAALAQQERQRAARRGLVVHDKQVRHGHAASHGKSSVTRVPPPGALSISMRPPCAATMRSAMARPSPLPFGLLE